MCMCMCVCVRACVCVCARAHTHTHTHTHTHKTHTHIQPAGQQHAISKDCRKLLHFSFSPPGDSVKVVGYRLAAVVAD